MIRDRFAVSRLVEGASTGCQDVVADVEVDCVRIHVVADGAGGISGGLAAAEHVARGVQAAAAQLAQDPDGEACASLLVRLDEEILGSKTGGETTAVVAVVRPSGIVGASVGDSGAVLVTASGWEELTRGQRRKPFVGTGSAVPVAFGRELPEGATLLLASDGLLSYADPNAIAEIARGSDLEAVARALVDSVRLRSGALQDDVGIVLCRQAS